MVGFTPEQILDIRRGGASFDARLDALAKLVRNITLERGHADPALVQAFFSAGWTEGNLIDALVVVGDKMVSNFLHGATQIPVDFPPAPALDA
jgi:alkylhydroperoxidase family enzyme